MEYPMNILYMAGCGGGTGLLGGGWMLEEVGSKRCQENY